MTQREIQNSWYLLPLKTIYIEYRDEVTPHLTMDNNSIVKHNKIDGKFLNQLKLRS